MMMKKLLVLLLVFGMTSAAGATLQISVNGNLEPALSEYTLLPSETLSLDIWTDADIGAFELITFMIVVDTTVGTITPGVAVHPMASFGAPAPGYTYLNENVIPPPGMEGLWGNVANVGYPVPPAIPAGTVLFDEIVFHADYYMGDTIVYLMDAPDSQQASIIYDYVVIHIPEPMTVALLGLGGLFLFRSRK